MATPLVPTDADAALERALADLVEPAWRVVDVRRATAKGPRADAVVVGPTGVFVIACARPQDKPRHRTRLAHGLLDLAESLARTTDTRRSEVHPVLCLTGDQPVSDWSRGVTVCGSANLAETLTFRRSLLSPAEVDDAARTVRHTLGSRGRHRA